MVAGRCFDAGRRLEACEKFYAVNWANVTYKPENFLLYNFETCKVVPVPRFNLGGHD